MATPEATALIQQIADLMQQYLALPEDTPLKQTFGEMLPEVQAAAGGGGGDVGAAPDMGALGAMMGGTPEQGGGPPMGNQDIVEGEPGPPDQEGAPDQAKDYQSARPGALEALKGKKKKGK